MSATLPLFPLHTVLFPGGRLALRIFETRYLDMIRRCLRDDACFGVCLIREGSEAGEPATFEPVGTSARIVDWSQRTDGLLGITAAGEQRFRVLRSAVQPDNLVVAEVEWLAEAPPEQIAPAHAPLVELLTGDRDGGDTAAVTDAATLGFRLSERLSVPPPVRQELLEIDAPSARLARIADMLQPLLSAAGKTRPA